MMGMWSRKRIWASSCLIKATRHKDTEECEIRSISVMDEEDELKPRSAHAFVRLCPVFIVRLVIYVHE